MMLSYFAGKVESASAVFFPGDKRFLRDMCYRGRKCPLWDFPTVSAGLPQRAPSLFEESARFWRRDPQVLQRQRGDACGIPVSPFAGGLFGEHAPTFDTLIFEEIRKCAHDFFKGTIVGRTVFHKELPFAVFCSMDFDVCP